ncbi:MAG TPA: hypothetical protein DCS93_16125 [Microscillaceae bacterium]|nr:hypothetical protein [Microscillaceae bacterium]
MLSQIQRGNDQETNQSAQSHEVTQKKERPGSNQGQKPSIQAKQKPIQAKQKPIQAKHKTIQAKHKPIQAKQSPVQLQDKDTESGTSSNQEEARVKQRVGALMNTDISDAKVHYNSDKPAQLMAEGTAQGNEVHLAPGKSKHLGHELTHVAQQKLGDVKPTMQANNGVGINNDPKLEKQADDIGAIAMGNQTIQAKAPQNATLSSSSNSNSSSTPFQLITSLELDTLMTSLNKMEEYKHLQNRPKIMGKQALWNVLVAYRTKHNINMNDIDLPQAESIITEHLDQYPSPQQKHLKINQQINHAHSLSATNLDGDITNANSIHDLSIYEMNSEMNDSIKSKIDHKIDETLTLADAAQVEFIKRMNKLKSTHQAANYEVKPGPLKKKERIEEKTFGKYDRDAGQVIDIVRGSLVFDTLEDLIKIEPVIKDFFYILRRKNDIGKETPAGYADMKINVRLDNGIVGELQLQVKSLNTAKTQGGGHSLYRIIRDLNEGKATQFDTENEHDLEKLTKIKDGFSTIKNTLTTKGNDDNHVLKPAEANAYKQLLNSTLAKLEAGNVLGYAKDGKEHTDLMKISKLVYENANKTINEQMEDERVQNHFQNLNQAISEEKATKEAKRSPAALAQNQDSNWFTQRFGATPQPNGAGIETLLNSIQARFEIPGDNWISETKKGLKDEGTIAGDQNFNINKVLQYFSGHLSARFQLIKKKPITNKFSVEGVIGEEGPICFILEDGQQYLLTYKK